MITTWYLEMTAPEELRPARDPGPRRVRLHTCTLDSPAALPAYRRRGFRVYDEIATRLETPGR